MPRYAELIYNGFWFSPEREMLQALIDKSQEKVEGTVRLKLYKGSARVVGRNRRTASTARARHLRGGPGLRPARRRGLHQAQRAAPAPRRPPRPRLTGTIALLGRSLPERLCGYCICASQKMH